MSRCGNSIQECLNCPYPDCINPDGVAREKPTEKKYLSDQRQREYMKRRRAEAKKKGLCMHCFKVRAEKGKYCHTCLEKMAGYRQKRKMKGVKT